MWAVLLCSTALNGDIPDTQTVQDATATAHYHLLLTLTIIVFIKNVKHENRKAQVINMKNETSTLDQLQKLKQCARRTWQINRYDIFHGGFNRFVSVLKIFHCNILRTTKSQSPIIKNNHDKQTAVSTKHRSKHNKEYSHIYHCDQGHTYLTNLPPQQRVMQDSHLHETVHEQHQKLDDSLLRIQALCRFYTINHQPTSLMNIIFTPRIIRAYHHAVKY